MHLHDQRTIIRPVLLIFGFRPFRYIYFIGNQIPTAGFREDASRTALQHRERAGRNIVEQNGNLLQGHLIPGTPRIEGLIADTLNTLSDNDRFQCGAFRKRFRGNLGNSIADISLLQTRTNTEYSLSEKIIINQKAASYVTVHVVQKGGLSDVLVDKELNPESIISMKIIGELDAEDFLTIQNMINLKNLDLEEVNLTELPTKAFYKMKTIENLILPHTLTIINDSEFYQNSLKSIIISSNVETIGEYAFYECPLKSINIPASVKAINKAAFMNCSSLATITFSKGSMLTKICGGKGFLSHGEKYYYGAFANCTALTSIEIPANVEIIEEAAFKNCTALTTVTFENNSSLKTICGAWTDYSYYGGAFSDCISLISIEIPASVETIEAAAFRICSKLATVTFEKGSQLKTIGGGYSNSSDYYGASRIVL